MKPACIITLFLAMTMQNAVSADESLEAFIGYQQSASDAVEIGSEAITDFYRRSYAFWMERKIDYNANPGKYADAMSLYHRNREKYRRDRTIELDRFEQTIEQFRRFDARNRLPANPTLFVGSSSIVFWETADSFPEYPVVNRGFGGASLPEIIHYYDDVIGKHAPSVMVVYCDIDVENGESPEFSANAFKRLVDRVDLDFPRTQIVFLSMKPTLIDDMLGKDVRRNKLLTNEILAAFGEENDNLHYVDITSVMFADDGRLRTDIFLDDGMHLNHRGYELWDPIVRQELQQINAR